MNRPRIIGNRERGVRQLEAQVPFWYWDNLNDAKARGYIILPRGRNTERAVVCCIQSAYAAWCRWMHRPLVTLQPYVRHLRLEVNVVTAAWPGPCCLSPAGQAQIAELLVRHSDMEGQPPPVFGDDPNAPILIQPRRCYTTRVPFPSVRGGITGWEKSYDHGLRAAQDLADLVESFSVTVWPGGPPEPEP